MSEDRNDSGQTFDEFLEQTKEAVGVARIAWLLNGISTRAQIAAAMEIFAMGHFTIPDASADERLALFDRHVASARGDIARHLANEAAGPKESRH